MNNKKSGSRTLLMSVLMSAPGPLIIGLGLTAGRSATQIADFVRRSAELLGIVMAYITYMVTNRPSGCSDGQKVRIERLSNLFVGAMMCLGGGIMFVLALLPGQEASGSVIPGLVIALLGVVANTIFWRRYTRLNRAEPNPIIAVQARLYRAKSLVDICVSAALIAVMLMPGSSIAMWLDRAGSAIVALYLIRSGIQTIAERIKN